MSDISESQPERDVLPFELDSSMSPREIADYNEALSRLPQYLREQREAAKRRHSVDGPPATGFSVVLPDETAAQAERYRQQDQQEQDQTKEE